MWFVSPILKTQEVSKNDEEEAKIEGRVSRLFEFFVVPSVITADYTNS
jgi:hypothetical protein